MEECNKNCQRKTIQPRITKLSIKHKDREGISWYARTSIGESYCRSLAKPTSEVLKTPEIHETVSNSGGSEKESPR